MFVALVVQDAMRMRRIKYISACSLTVTNFYTLSLKIYDFGKMHEPELCVLIFNKNFDRNTSHPMKNFARYHKPADK